MIASPWQRHGDHAWARIGDRGDRIAIVWDLDAGCGIGWLLYASRIPSFPEKDIPSAGYELGDLGKAQVDMFLMRAGVALGPLPTLPEAR